MAEAQKPARRQLEDDEAEAQFQRDLQAALEASKPSSSKEISESSDDGEIEEVAAPPAQKTSVMSERALMEKERLECLKR